MENDSRARFKVLLKDAVVPPDLVRDVLPRLESFLQPFARSLLSPEQRSNARLYVEGLLSDLKSKDVESIAYLHDRERQGLQKFIGQAAWDHRPLITELALQVGAELGQADAVLVFDPSAFPKKGQESVGVQRQWCGRLGKLDNCQVGVYLGYVSRVEHALIDFRLYLPKAWTSSKTRRAKAGIPKDVRFQTRHEQALEMLDGHGPLLPHGWISGDDEMGRCAWFRQELQQRNESYLLAVPSNTLVRDLKAAAPPYSGKGRKPQAPFVRVDRWSQGLPEKVWTIIEVRDGEKGPIVVQGAWTLVQARTDGKPSDEVEMLVVFREHQSDGSWKHDYLRGHGPVETPLCEYARVFKAQHRIEECLKRAKGEAGLADYQVRTWEGWHHHQTLALLATWFLTQETRRGKNTDSRVECAAGASVNRGSVEPAAEEPERGTGSSDGKPPIAAQRGGTLLSLATPQALATTAV